MGKTLDEFRTRRSFVTDMHHEESVSRISGFLDWLDSNETTIAILSEIENNNDRVVEILEKAKSGRHPPQVSNPEDVAQIGLYLMRQVKLGEKIWGMSQTYNIKPPFSTNRVQDWQDAVVERYIEPAIEYIQDKLIERTWTTDDLLSPSKSMVHLSGDFRGAILNINSTLTKSSQVVENIPNADENAKAELVKLLDELKEVLSEISPYHADSAEAVAWAAETLIEAKTSEKPNPIKVEITKEGLIKAAKNLAVAMPIVLIIAEKIIAAVDKFK